MLSLTGQFRIIKPADLAHHRAASDAALVALDPCTNAHVGTLYPYMLFVRGEQAQELRTILSQRRIRETSLFLAQIDVTLRKKRIVAHTIDLVCGTSVKIDRKRMYLVAVDPWNLMVEKAIELEGGKCKARRHFYLSQFYQNIPEPVAEKSAEKRGMALNPPNSYAQQNCKTSGEFQCPPSVPV